jgi:hypothetical protein
MLRYYKVAALHIYNTDTHERTNLKQLFRLLDDGVDFEIIYKPTGESIKDNILKKYETRKKHSKLSDKVDKTMYGPDTPLNEVKYFSCNECNKLTTNRFKCSECWNGVNDNYEDEFVYML